MIENLMNWYIKSQRKKVTFNKLYENHSLNEEHINQLQ